MGEFDMDLDERLKNAEEATDLNKVIKGILREANDELFNEETYNYNKNLSILNNQIVGAEYNFYL
jgi:hypothetical protein